MATLFDKLSQPAAPAVPANNQSRIETLLAAKKGKMGAPAGPAASNIGEQVIQDQNKGAMQQATMATSLEGGVQQAKRTGLENTIQQAGDEQKQQFDMARQTAMADQGRGLANIAGQEAMQHQELDAAKTRKLQGINAKAESGLRNLAAQSSLELDDVFSNFKRSNQELEFRQDAANIEQLGTLLALQDRKYVDELNRIGETRKFYDQKNWNEEKARIIYGDNLNSLLNQLNFNRSEDISNRDFLAQMSNISIDQAVQMANAATADANAKNVGTAATQAITTAAGTDWSKFKTPDVAPQVQTASTNTASAFAARDMA